MPVFQYSARNPQGQVERGLAQGPTLDHVVAQLTRKGLEVQEIGAATNSHDPVDEAPGAPPTGARSTFATEVVGPAIGTVSLESQSFFFRQLSVMLKAGINPAQALGTLAENTHHPKLRAILLETKEHVTHGRPMSAGFQRYPEAFSPLVLSMVRVAEASGFLDEQCELISKYLDRDIHIRNLIRRETAWPKITFFFSIVIILGTNTIITALALGSGGQLPVPYGVWTVVLAVAVAWFFWKRYALRDPSIRAGWDNLMRRIPGVGGINQGFAMAKFSRAFGAMFRGGIPIPVAVRLAADASDNEDVRRLIHPAVGQIEQGRSISESFAATRAFSPLVVDMTRTGETTGELDSMLDRVADYYEEEGITKAQVGAKILSVVCVVILAIYVLFFAISAYGGMATRALQS